MAARVLDFRNGGGRGTVTFCPAPIGLEAAGTKSKVEPFIGILIDEISS
jgi:hypothetical protein